MSKTKAIIIGVIVLLFFSMGVTIQTLSRKYQQEKADRERLWQNNLALTAQNLQHKKVIYTKNEFMRILSDSLKKTLDDLAIKPKTVTKIVERVVIDRVTDTIKVPVTPTSDLTWSISDTDKCWIWKAELEMIDDYPEIERTLFEYRNKTMDYFYSYRPHKFLCIRYGKKQIKQITVPECGEATEKIIEVIKNK